MRLFILLACVIIAFVIHVKYFPVPYDLFHFTEQQEPRHLSLTTDKLDK